MKSELQSLRNLSAALPKIETLRSKKLPFPRPTDADAQVKGIAGILDEEMGFVD